MRKTGIIMTLCLVLGLLTRTDARADYGESWTHVIGAAPWSKRDYPGVAVLNDRIFVIGGQQAESNTGIKDVWASYNGIDWSQPTTILPWTAAPRPVVMTFGGELWVVTGTGRGEVWHSQDGITWQRAISAAPWLNASHLVGTVFDNRMWIVGTTAGGTFGTNKVWSSVNGSTWTLETEAPPWGLRYDYCLTAFNGKLWIIGEGLSASGLYKKDVWSSPDGKNWTLVLDGGPWPTRVAATALTHDGRMWLIGGGDTYSLRDVWVTSDGLDWTAATTLAPWSKSAHGALSFGGRLWIIAGDRNGRSGIGGEQNDVWVSDAMPIPHPVPPPKVRSTVPAPSATLTMPVNRIRLQFSRFMDPTSLIPDNFVLKGSGGDANFLDGDEIPIRKFTVQSLDDNQIAVVDLGCCLARDSYQLTVKESVVDTYGLKLDGEYTGALPTGDDAEGGDFTLDFTVNNAPLLGVDWIKATVPNDAPWGGSMYMSATALGDKMYVMGGSNTLFISPEVWESGNGRDWGQSIAAAPWKGVTGRYHHASVTFGNKIWVLGGGDDQFFNDVWSSSNGADWTRVTAGAGWSPRWEHAAVVHNGKMWVLGGEVGPSAKVNDVWSSEDGASWTQVTPQAAWSPRSYHKALSFNGRLWVLGSSPEADVWYSDDGASWTLAVQSGPWGPRTRFSAVTMSGRMWLIAGQCLWDERDVWYSADGIQWLPATFSMPLARSTHASVVFNNRMWILGGFTAGTFMGTVQRNAWYSEGMLPPSGDSNCVGDWLRYH